MRYTDGQNLEMTARRSAAAPRILCGALCEIRKEENDGELDRDSVTASWEMLRVTQCLGATWPCLILADLEALDKELKKQPREGRSSPSAVISG